jgi:predicted DsbA family dithiol-disulfide isomerase
MSGSGGADKTGALVARHALQREIAAVEGGGQRVDSRLIVFADYTCPYCFLAESELVRLRADGIVVEPAAFELRPPGAPLPADDDARVRAAHTRAAAAGAALGRRLPQPRPPVRTRKAHEAVAYARGAGAEIRLHEALYRAYWDAGRDIGRIDVLSEIGAEQGLDTGSVRVSLDIDQWTAFVEGQEAWAAQLGIRAVPAYVLAAGDDVLGVRVGLQRYTELRDWIMVNDDV